MKQKLALLLGVSLFAFYALILLPSGPVEGLRLSFQDLLEKVFYSVREKPSVRSQIVMVTIDDDSYRALNRKWPWRRELFAELLEKLAAVEPSAVFLDFSFVGESEFPEDDYRLAEALRRCRRVFLLAYLSGGEVILPQKLFQEAALGTGIVNKPLDRDLGVRNAQAFYGILEGTPSRYALELQMASLHLGTPEISLDSQKKAVLFSKGGSVGLKLPIRHDGTFPIDFRAIPKDFQTIPFWRVLKDPVDPSFFRGKIILVGRTGRILHDLHRTPLEIMPGTFIIGNTLLALLSRSFISEVPFSLYLSIFCLILLLTGSVSLRWGPLKGFFFLLAELGAIGGATWLLRFQQIRLDLFGLWMAALGVYPAVLLYRYVGLFLESLQLKEEAIRDGLTGLFTFRFLQVTLHNEWERAKRYQSTLSFLILDIDHFKRVNDTYGHQNGNVVLKKIATVIASTTRRNDISARYGGEEFCLILPQTDLKGARECAELLRKRVAELRFDFCNPPLQVTVSVGVSTSPKGEIEDPGQLIEQADRALYAAKEGGRNRVCLFAELPVNNAKVSP